jgi:hypothetical protein
MELKMNLNSRELDDQDSRSRNCFPIPSRDDLEELYTNGIFWFLILGFPTLGALFSVACFTAIIGILWGYNEKKAPVLSHGLILNAILSVLSTVSKCSLVYSISQAVSQWKWGWFQKGRRKLQQVQAVDNASRGPWGSIAILGQHKTFHFIPWSSSYGACIGVRSFLAAGLCYPAKPTLSPVDHAVAKQARFVFPNWTDPNYQSVADRGPGLRMLK